MKSFSSSRQSLTPKLDLLIIMNSLYEPAKHPNYMRKVSILLHFHFTFRYCSRTDLHRQILDAITHLGPILFIFMHILAKTRNAFQWDAYRPLVDRSPPCTVGGGGVPAGGCTCPEGVPTRGEYLPRGVYLLGKGAPAWGCTCPGGVPAPGVYLSQGMSGGVPAEGGVPAQVLPPVNRMTDMCKNITLPQTSFAGGNYAKKICFCHPSPGNHGPATAFWYRQHIGSSFFYNSCLIRWIYCNKIKFTKKNYRLDQGLNPDHLLSCQAL